MVVSIVNGSPRKNGATAKILLEMKSVLEDFNIVKVNYFNLSEIEMNFCIGCEKCYNTGECIILDGTKFVANSIKKSDAIIFGSPTYGSNVTGLLKNFMDRGHFTVEQSLYGKKCLSISTYEIADGISVIKNIKKFFMFSGGSNMGSLACKVDFNHEPITIKTKNKINRIINKLYKTTIDNKKKSIIEFILNDVIVVGIIWKNYFKKKPKQYKGVISKYKQMGIHSSIGNLHDVTEKMPK